MWGATVTPYLGVGFIIKFQSTLPVWGATETYLKKRLGVGVFQSTLPVWGATGVLPLEREPQCISIHAPRVGSDHDALPSGVRQLISIHAPRVGSDPARGTV